MRIPNTINKNTLKVYEINKELCLKQNYQLQSYNFDKWDIQFPKSLKEICVEAIATNWAVNPVLEEIVSLTDRCLLLDILPTDLPLQLTIPKIKDNTYWKKCFEKRWPNFTPQNVADAEEVFEIVRSNDDNNSHQNSRRSSTSKLKSCEKRSWKECYIEMHIKEYMENLKPEDYDPEKVKELCDICGSFVKVLQINQLQYSSTTSSRIPLNAILSGFENLTELSICFKQTYAGKTFSWNVLESSFQDIKLFAKGLEKLRLHKLRVRNSDIDCDKLIVILKAFLRHNDLKTIDFSHCKIGNRGLLAVSRFILDNAVSSIILANNKIGLQGIDGLSYALCQKCCEVKTVDLRLNQLFDDVGNILMSRMPFATSVTSLSLSGCGFTKKFTFAEMLKANCSLELFDISNNNIGEEAGNQILNALECNKTIKKIDIRMCGVNSETELKIQEKVQQNRRLKGLRRETYKSLGELNDELMSQETLMIMETIFN